MLHLYTTYKDSYTRKMLFGFIVQRAFFIVYHSFHIHEIIKQWAIEMISKIILFFLGESQNFSIFATVRVV